MNLLPGTITLYKNPVRFRIFIVIVFLSLTGFFASPVYSQIDFTYQSAFSYLKGKDAGAISSQWIMPGYDYSGWETGNAPFRYGDGASGVELTDMQNNYSTLFLRSTFECANVALLKQVNFLVDYDDGFVIWINGVAVLIKNAPSDLLYNSFAPDNHESGTGETFAVDAGILNLIEGKNSIAVMCFNVNLTSTDFYFDVAFQSEIDMPEKQDSTGVSFNVKSGFFDTPFSVILTAPDLAQEIVYTLDGSNPQNSQTIITTSSPASIYIDPASAAGRPVSPAVIIRASVKEPGYKPSKPVSATYIFLDKIKNQVFPGGGWPAGSVNGQLIDLAIDSLVAINPIYSGSFIYSLLDIPTISVITDLKNLFDPASGIYVNAKGHGLNWEKECSVELINPDGTEGFKINAGLRIRGGYSRNPGFPKHAFRLFFREIYGSTKLNYPLFGDEGVSQFDKVDLRSEQNYAWNNGGSNNSFVREVFSRDTQRDMGQPYTRSRYYHLYLNGMYWGMYQTQERSEARYAASYFGGDYEDYDVIKVAGENSRYDIEATDGSIASWQRLWDMCKVGFESNANYFKVEGKDAEGNPVKGGEVMVDIDNLIDYMLVIFYSGNFDGPVSKFLKRKVPNNFYAIDDREDKSTGFKFFTHDNEHTLFDEPHPPGIGINENIVNIGTLQGEMRMEVADFSSFHPQWLHFKLSDNSEYSTRFADRAYNHFQSVGVFSPDSALIRLNERIEEVDMAVIAESARWGDAKRNPAPSYTRNSQWLPEVNKIRNNFIPVRPGIVVAQLKSANLYPGFDAPEILSSGKKILLREVELISDMTVDIVNPNSFGNIYYTLDGSDPRKSGGGFSAAAIFTNSRKRLSFDETNIIKARVYNSGNWSALREVRFLKQEEHYTDLKVTEVNYHPKDIISGSDTLSGKDYEFIEFKNTGNHSIDLSGLELDSAVRYKFPEHSVLPPKGFYVITSKTDAFYEYYGLVASGNYQGNLSNSGEEILLKDPAGKSIINFIYSDTSPWPGPADGDGYSLTSAEANPSGDPSDLAYWRLSSGKGGNPFADNTIAEPDTPTDAFTLKLTAYPNPANAQVNISVAAVDDIDKYELVLTDIAGKVVYKEITGRLAEIDLRQIGLGTGVYILKMSSGQYSGWLKIVFVK